MIDRNTVLQQGGTFVWSKLRRRYHDPFCPWALKILPQNRQAGDEPNTLKDAPRSPCKVCRPCG
jgi:hypothetical protein